MTPITGSEPLLSIVRRYASVLLAGSVLSCAATQAPHIVNIEVASGYHGNLHVITCENGAASGVADDGGNIRVTDCPSGNRQIELAVTRGTKVYRISSSDMVIRKTGDGIVVSIDAHLTE